MQISEPEKMLILVYLIFFIIICVLLFVTPELFI